MSAENGNFTPENVIDLAQRRRKPLTYDQRLALGIGSSINYADLIIADLEDAKKRLDQMYQPEQPLEPESVRDQDQ